MRGRFKGCIHPRLIASLAALSCLALAVAGCGGDDDQSESAGGSGGTASVEAFEVPATAFSANTGYLPFIVARENGFFGENGVDPEFLNVAGGGTALRAFTSSDAPIGIEGLPSALPGIQRGGEYTIVGQISRVSDTWVATRADSGIDSIEDLRGKKIGVTSPGSTLEAIAVAALDQAGLSEDDAEIVHLGSVADELVALEEGLVDAIAAAGQVQLYHHTETLGDWRLLGRGSDFVPLIDAVIVAKNDFLEENPEAMRGFLQAIRDGQEYLAGREPNDELVRLVTGWQEITDDELTPAVEQMLGDLATGENASEFFGDLSVDREAFMAVAESLVEADNLAELPDYEEYVDDSFLPSGGA